MGWVSLGRLRTGRALVARGRCGGMGGICERKGAVVEEGGVGGGGVVRIWDIRARGEGSRLWDCSCSSNGVPPLLGSNIGELGYGTKRDRLLSLADAGLPVGAVRRQKPPLFYRAAHLAILYALAEFQLVEEEWRELWRDLTG